MGKRTDIKTILILGSGPIVIGQGCEFDYSGVQACKVLRREGYRVVLVNSNPATIMTDPEFADATYIEPLTAELVEKIIIAEQPDAVLPTVGGQTGLNLAVELAESGILDKYGVQLIGADLRAIRLAEDRSKFKQAMIEAGVPVPVSHFVHSLEEAEAVVDEIGFPMLVRASFTLGGTGGGVAYSREQFEAVVQHGLRSSPVNEVLIERSLLGWKEYELEVMRDKADNFVVVCSIENVDPMGVHTGDSITVAPAQTLTDKEYQYLRDLAKTIMRAVGVETGGSNVQFAVNPENGEVIVIEMNPRVSRSSALASKATGFPIAKIAALLAVGYTLDEIPNDITRVTPASFEPSIDYCVVKIPRWNFEKFPGVDATLGPQMKSVGEVMAIGRTFTEALNKAIRGLDIGIPGFSQALAEQSSEAALSVPTAQRLFQMAVAMGNGRSSQEIIAETAIDPWFVVQLQEILEIEAELIALGSQPEDAALAPLLRQAKRHGFSDVVIAKALGWSETAVRQKRLALGITPVYYRVDTCAAEFEAHTPYLYSTYESACEADPTNRKKVMILGGGPNRIGQGIEFDYCCVQACWALRELGYETIMVNCNPETVSTDYDTADRLYFESLTLEDVLNIVDLEQPEGVIVQFGGQTPINLTAGLAAAGVPIWGTPPDSIDLAEARGRFGDLLHRLEIDHPAWGLANSMEEALEVVHEIGYPVLVRPSFVLGGRAMAIAYDDDSLRSFLAEAARVSPGNPVLIDQFIEDAFEVDVDAVADGERVVMAGVMQHIEEAGIHSGDSACVLPPYKISLYHLSIIQDYTEKLGLALNVRGLMNVQFAIKDDVVYVIEVNPRASRTVPFVSKATGLPVARIAAQVQAGCQLAELNFTHMPPIDGFFVKEAVLPFNKLPGADTRLGPEMRSTGEVMGHASQFGHAFAKSQLAVGTPLPLTGAVLITVNDFDKSTALKIARDLHRMGFKLYATEGTAVTLEQVNLPVTLVPKASEPGLNTVRLISSGGVQLIINTPLGQQAHEDQAALRAAAIRHNILLISTMSAAQAAVSGIKALRKKELRVRSLQQHHAASASPSLHS
ncbi:MAG: carbamoyl-phosphate synthase large subunit [Ardenticatenaceae bacterium]|nr:carbamoyl-phosphate synthase large subunit [Ardenticatenaceae bacterium]MCB8928851.1 carbamoyl-phosphate synthase large subunit [Ardenticatenaceae bacterium]MCB8949537.1 carbamoyl-phosphate synthase large subunit [Ardenticatenaceae bacterium]